MARDGCAAVTSVSVSSSAAASDWLVTKTRRLRVEARMTPPASCSEACCQSEVSSFSIARTLIPGLLLIVPSLGCPVLNPKSKIANPKSSRSPPSSPVFLDQLIGLCRSPGTRFIVWEAGLLALPVFENRHNDFPATLCHIATRIERRVSEDTIQQQAFISLRRGNAK